MAFCRQTIRIPSGGKVEIAAPNCRGCDIRLTCRDFAGKRNGRRVARKRRPAVPPAQAIIDRPPVLAEMY